MLAALAFVFYRIASFDPLTPNPYDSRSFVSAFNAAWPQGTSEATIDAEYVGKRLYTKSPRWHYEIRPGFPVINMQGEGRDHYLITYLRIDQSDLEAAHGQDGIWPSAATFFNVRYSLAGRFQRIERVGSASGKVKDFSVILTLNAQGKK